MCDNCSNPASVESYDVSKAYEQIKNTLAQSEDSLTLLKLIDKWYKILPRKSSINKHQMTHIIGNLLLQGFLKEYRSYTAYTVNCYIKPCDKTYDTIIVNLVKDKNLDSFFKCKMSVIDVTEPKSKKKRGN